ncbi:MAG: tRNA (guanosine(46)-N7)-methyltransferase TrmB, partial [Bacteroidales bacterium]|nr:tRNA (guanosine(46)-N7)-methyltransferase TrmB [Bacteroidales bacterium]
KGARLWRGAKEATLSKMGNVAFLRTRIEFIPAFFAPSEVAEIWLTFSDPQLHHENSRLSSPLFLKRYREFLAPGGLIHLKTDSMFLHQYTLALCRENSFPILARSEDLYTDLRESRRARLGGAEALSDAQVDAIFEVHTYYETMFSRQGYRITYLCFCIGTSDDILSPSSFDADYWRSVEGPRHSVALPDL